ncbi:MAG: NAD(P)(+) transhydrogenase (Re/Si-specific) subunit beta, partial [Acidobacteria bacterium]|nr:NAD(P)(+) transhydrogenase (Re/Si-specific) subunit beta [Acidobacteriota bacterium]
MTTLLYLAAGVLFILGLRGLGSPRTARRGNLLAAIGMLLAIVVTVADIIDEPGVVWGTIIAGFIVGGGIGAYLALRVQMTAMPQLVAAFNGFGGGASALVASAEVVATDGVFSTETSVTVALSIAIG